MIRPTIFFKDGPLSPWHICSFKIDGISYNCIEQYMMAEKARLFGDAEILEKIMRAQHPEEQKAFGRKVRNFDDKLWIQVAKEVVYKANYAKFSQNKRLKEELYGTGEAYLAEASVDSRWGIGLEEDIARTTNKSKWPGTNWFGKILMKVRERLKEVTCNE